MNKNYLLAGFLSLALIGTVNATDNQDDAMVSFSKNDYAGWKHQTKEDSASIVTDNNIKVLSFKVTVNHKADHKGNPEGKYLKGWPRLRFRLGKTIDLAKFKYLRFDYKISSNRENPVKTHFSVNFHSNGAKYDYVLDLGKEDGKWHEAKISIPEMIKKAKKTAGAWTKLSYIQLVIAEAKYKNGTKLDIKVKDIFLIK
ncbi:MAG: hypothetical protein L3J71_08815 [Victivallaceae bacterium]|nr:hypothetical protein [Victivallaceae bacterium]